MRKKLLFFVVAGVSLLLSYALAQAQCLEDPNDNGLCDTMYVEVWPGDEYLVPGEQHHALFPIRVTHDLPDPDIDSIASFVIPLCYTSSNPAAQAQVDPFYNSTGLYFFSNCFNSVFRPLPDCQHPLESNWMWSLLGTGGEWDSRIVNLGDQHFWLALLPSGSDNQLFWEASRVLLAAMTFKLEDSTTICFDTCFWPPASRFGWSRSDAVSYVPRTNLPYCVSILHQAVGDCNADGTIDVSDAVYLINYLFRDGPAPPLQVGDVNCDGVIQSGDVVFLLNYLFRGGPEPSC
ncbi:MAG: hypothetical protein GTO24_10555 [candidate division Zixibacteria bacterium]|nr:hypothetical protein [candidate division Zixibacteria bacterium]